MTSFCQKCGAELTLSAAFCPGCGAPITAAKPKKTSALQLGCLVLLGMAGVLMMTLWMIGSVAPAPHPEPLRRVTYAVNSTGPGSVSLTFRNESGGTEQKTVPLPWILELKVKSGGFLYLSAQKQQEHGTIQAVIYVDGQVIQEAEANTSYGVASVSGSVP